MSSSPPVNPSARWVRVSSLLSRVLDLPEAQRTAFLADAIRQEPTLGTEVLALFDEMRQSEGFLEQPPSVVTDGAFGPYQVVGKLGEGGMGVVHLAERSDGQFVRRVAVKRIGTAMPRPDVLRRFRDERQILARLDHPNIARLLDAGLDAAGVPYLVMEHVEGVPLHVFCRERTLTVQERLALFVKVCVAVQHAHQNLVIHRDIKPGNILVTAEAEPKLLDFGIAKVFGEPLGGEATATMNRALTLDYASPEQVRGEAVTTASDVYSLGVVLYELLADRKPYELATKSLSEAVQVVCEWGPAPVSTVAPPSARGELAGDLDGIVRKAMEKTPRDRYASVAELAEDVVAHLGHRPVKARRPSFGYVARKFARRHRAGVALAATVLAMLLGGVAAVLWQARIAERERARAEQRFGQVRQLANWVIFDLQDGVRRLTGSTELRRQMVERSLAYLDSLAADAVGDVGLQRELAGAYRKLGDVLGKPESPNLGDVEGAQASYHKAEALFRQVIRTNPGDREARRSLARLLDFTHAVHGARSSAAPDAATQLEESVALWRDLEREDPKDPENQDGLVNAEYTLYVLKSMSRPDEALPHLENALRVLRRTVEARPADVDAKGNLAECERMMGRALSRSDPPRSRQHALRAAQLDSERVAAEPHNAEFKVDLARDYEQLGNGYAAQGALDDARRYFEQALPLLRQLWDGDRANALARNNLARVLVRLGETHVHAGRHDLAAPLLRDSIQLAATTPAPKERRLLGTLARAHLSLGEAEFVAGRSPCRSYRRLEELLVGITDADKLFPAETAGLRERARERLKSCPS